MKILVVEDEDLLRDTIVTILSTAGFDVDHTNNGDEGLFFAEQIVYDLLILDISLPGTSGLDILKRLRTRKDTVPIFMLTARDRVEDRVLGLDAGADDYMVKPFAVSELFARVKALLRRKGGETTQGLLSYKNITLNPKLKEAYFQSEELWLTAREYELLEFLVLNREQILTKEQIFDRLWGVEAETGLGIVDVYIHFLRKKLSAFSCNRLIRTIRGVGYMLRDKASGSG
ncbi:response regulator transcription factor [Acetonema longum]|uniref:Two-component response regulator n=1 Tax=Acetonema longum DSM 6540 TaxID=1009370 RepID=F7NP21_9FIRM|nr:response regulator transcription factor [Acetonema longum]EGO62144.1 two-component response regulator [Acetonema longum DSM 6540]